MDCTITLTMVGAESLNTQHQEDHYRLLVESIEDYAIYRMDPAGKILTWNLGAEQIKRYTASEIVGRNFHCLYTSEDFDNGIPDRNLVAAAEHGRCTGEGWRLRKDGQRFWASFVITAMRDRAGALIGFSKVIRDLTDRKLQEDTLRAMQSSLRHERDRLHAAAESSMDAFWICESVHAPSGDIIDFTFTYLNSNVEKMVSIPRSKLLGGRMCELLPVNRTLGIFEHYKQVVLTGEPYIAEFAIKAQDVLSAWIRVQAVRLGDGVAITAADITSRKQAEERILHLATHDPLTGLPNRSLLNDRISQAIKHVERNGGLLALCVIDLDGFKPINDTLGHRAGDTVLTVTAQRILTSIRATDTASRIGGDEFVVVLSRIQTIADIELCAQKILKSIESPIPLVDHRTREVTITCSIGIAVYSSAIHTVDDLLHHADQAMYSAKRNGRNGLPRYTIATTKCPLGATDDPRPDDVPSAELT